MLPQTHYSVRMARKPKLPAAPPNTVSLYVRLSKAADDENLSREGMLADVRAVAAREGLQVVGEHVDDGKSGAIRQRPAFTAWLDDARELRASTLCAWHVDRMTREGLNVAATIMDIVEGKNPEGAAVHAPVRLMDTRGLDSAGSDAWRMQFVVMAEVARAERERMRDRSREMHARLKAAGRWAGPAPFGFRTVPNPEGAGKVLEIYEPEARYIREAAERVLAGEGVSAVCRWMNADGPKPRRAAEWSRATITQTLTSSTVLHLLFGPADRRAIQAAIKARGSGGARGTGRSRLRLLSGLLRCSGCGEKLAVGRNRGGEFLYRCGKRANGQVCPRPVAVNAEPAEKFIKEYFLDGWGRLPMARRVAVVLGADEAAEAEEGKAAALRTLAESPTEEAFAALRAAQALLEVLADLPTATVVRNVPTGRTVAEEWGVAPTDVDRRAMLADHIEAIFVQPGERGRRFNGDRLDIVAHPDVEDCDAE